MELKQTMQSLRSKANDAAQLTAEKTRLLTQISRNKVQILKLQERIRRACLQLGKTYYKDYITDEEPDEAEYLPLCDRISEAYRQIAVLQDEITDGKAKLGV